MSETTDDDDSKGANLGLAPRSLSYLTPSLPLASIERDTLTGLLQERCIQARMPNTGLIALQNSESVETRLANLKDVCNCMLVSYLTTSSQDLHKLKLTEEKFFNQVVAERQPDLLVNVCDYWL
jgi:hypothetical protein